MEFLAEIIDEQRIKEAFWKYKYTFLDVQTGKIDYFLHNKKVNYTPKLVGKLKLFEDNGLKFYQSFNQDEFIPSKENEKEKTLTQLEKNASQNIELPTSEKYYLLLDNSSIHDPPGRRPSKTLKEAGLLSMEELARQKNIELVYLPKYTPQINPIELCFNTTRHFTENLPTDDEEELEKSVKKIIDMINGKDLTKYFRHCQEFFSFGKSGN